MVESSGRGKARQAETGGAGAGEGDEAEGAEAEQERQERAPSLQAEKAPNGGVIVSSFGLSVFLVSMYVSCVVPHTACIFACAVCCAVVLWVVFILVVCVWL